MQKFNPLLKSNFQKREPHATIYTIYKKGSTYIAEPSPESSLSKISGTDAATVINSVINAIPAIGGKILLRSASYVLNSEIQLNKNFVSIVGEFRNSTNLQLANATMNGINITADYVSVGSMTIQSPTVTKSNGAGIYLSGSYEATLHDLFISGQFRGIECINSTLVYADNISIVDTIATTGIGLLIDGGNDFYLNDCIMDKATGTQPLAGIYIVKHGGGWFTNSDIIRSGRGINLGQNLAGHTAGEILWLWFDSVAVDTTNSDGILVYAQDAATIIKGIVFDNCWSASSATQYGFRTIQAAGVIDGITLSDSRFFNNGRAGIFLNGGKNILVSSNQISGNSQLEVGTYNGLVVDVSTTHVNIMGNRIGQMAQFGNTQGYGIVFNNNPQDYVYILGNDLSLNVSGGFNYAAMNSTCMVANNVGYNPQPWRTLVVGASPYTYTNTSGCIENIYVRAGTVSLITITRNAVANAVAAITNTQLQLYPGDAVTVTYTVLPGIEVQPM